MVWTWTREGFYGMDICFQGVWRSFSYWYIHMDLWIGIAKGAYFCHSILWMGFGMGCGLGWACIGLIWVAFKLDWEGLRAEGRKGKGERKERNSILFGFMFCVCVCLFFF